VAFLAFLAFSAFLVFLACLASCRVGFRSCLWHSVLHGCRPALLYGCRHRRVGWPATQGENNTSHMAEKARRQIVQTEPPQRSALDRRKASRRLGYGPRGGARPTRGHQRSMRLPTCSDDCFIHFAGRTRSPKLCLRTCMTLQKRSNCLRE
jgi:hypothetical protein